MISPDGWLDWAIRLPGDPNKVSKDQFERPLVNAVRGIFLHSAEGYASTLLDPRSQYGYMNVGVSHSWHLTNLFDGTLYQHHSLLRQTWHATAANPYYIGVENEGFAPREPSLTDAQVATARRFIAEIAAWRGWTPSRPTGPAEKTHTLWEHNEVVRLGGSHSRCPSGRIPWDKIMAPQEDDMKRHNSIATSLQGATGGATVSLNDFDLPPPPASRLRIELYLQQGTMQVLDADGSYAGQVGWDGARYGFVDVSAPFSLQGDGVVAQLGVVGYWP